MQLSYQEILRPEIPREECGIVGVYGHPEAAKMAYLGLYALQHRGQESAGIVASDGEKLRIYKNKGLVSEVFSPRERLDELKGSMAIGHVRYSTTGSNRIANAQPLLVNYRGGSLAIAHNGNLINAAELRSELEGRGAIFQGTADSEIIVHQIAQAASDDFLEGLTTSLYRMRGAWTLLFLREKQMDAVKDPRGIRPLCIGTLDGATVVASESCALDIMGAQHLRELKPGEMIIVGDGGVRHEFPFPPVEERFCVFEYIYYSRPDSVMHGKSVYQIRLALGERLAQEQPAPADLVIPTPDSSNAAAIGYAKAAGLPFHLGLIRSHYIGRTFIEPDQGIRNFGAKLKYSPVASLLEGKSVVVVDDSIVRGTTSVKIVEMLRRAGARQVHLRISAPPWKHPCFYGIDTPTEQELIANQLTHDEMTKHFGCDTLGFLSLEGLMQVVPRTQTFCTACFNGDYPAGKPVHFTKNIMEQTAAAKR
ncbi:amidophosphoribosyltransferase [bacterium]|nr:amidophosphoribosyltransferase [bacterium]